MSTSAQPGERAAKKSNDHARFSASCETYRTSTVRTLVSSSPPCDQPGGDCHKRVENRPRGAKDPARRVPRRLLQAVIPVSEPTRGCEAADRCNREDQRQRNHEQGSRGEFHR